MSSVPSSSIEKKDSSSKSAAVAAASSSGEKEKNVGSSKQNTSEKDGRLFEQVESDEPIQDPSRWSVAEFVAWLMLNSYSASIIRAVQGNFYFLMLKEGEISLFYCCRKFYQWKCDPSYN
jgi:hypothetical protein